MVVFLKYLAVAVVLALLVTWLFFEVIGGCSCSSLINYMVVFLKYLAGEVVLAKLITCLLLLSIWWVQLF